jgi:hypothetical protein
MRRIKTALLILVIVVSSETLHRYFDSLWFQWEASENNFSWRWLDEHSLWLYRVRGPDGRPASPYKVAPYFSPIDPDDGPNWEIRIPGWIPGGISIIALSLAAYGLFRVWRPRAQTLKR